MKKTFITLLALAGIAMGEPYLFDFKGSQITSSSQKSITLGNPGEIQLDATSTGNLSSGSWETLTWYDIEGHMNEAEVEEWTGISDLSAAAQDYIMSNGSTTLTLTYTGLTAGASYDVCVIGGGYAHTSSGQWGTWSCPNEYTTEITSANIPAKAIGTIALSDVVADQNGEIVVQFTASAFHKVTLSAATIQFVSAPPVPEPATATLSLLALAGLAARRRRA